MAFSLHGTRQGGYAVGPVQNAFEGANLAEAQTARDTYFTANPTKLAAYDGNPFYLIRLSYGVTTNAEYRSGGVWLDYTPFLQGLPGEVASLVGVPVNEIPYKKLDGTFAGSNMRVLDNGSLLAPPNFGVESGSVMFGDVLKLSEAAGFLAITNNLNGNNYTILDYYTPRDGATVNPHQFKLNGAEVIFNAQPNDSQILTANPLLIQYTVQHTARNNALTFRANAPMTNVRIKIALVNNGVVAKYIPNKTVWEKETGGLTWTTGDNTFDFEDTPIIFNTGDLISFEIRADSVSMKGSVSGTPYIASTQQQGVFYNAVMEYNYTPEDVRDKLTSLAGSNRLDVSSLKNVVLTVAGRTGAIALSASDVSGLAPVATTGAYSSLSGLPLIPTKTSDLTNDAAFITSGQAPVQSVVGRTGAVVVTQTDVGLANVDNTSDVNKPVSTAQQTAINLSLSQHNAAADPHPQYTTTAEAASAAPVQTVNSLTGNVVLTTGNISEVGNLYYTDARVQTYVTGAGYNVKSAASVGAGAAIYQADTAGALSFRSIIGTGAITITQNANDITINTPPNAINSVNGFTGTVVLNTSNITENTNLYYTDTRVTSYLSGSGYTVKSVASSGSGSSLYVGNSSGAVSLRSVIATGIATVTQNSNDITINVPANLVSSVNGQQGAVVLTTSNVAEGSNLYYTDTHVGSYLTTNGYVVKTLASVGAGSSLVANVGPSATIRSVIGANLITVTQNANDITISNPTVLSGTYTPTLTMTANLAATTAYACQYMRVGSVVTVTGRVTLDPTNNGQMTNVEISLPITSNFTLSEQCAGTSGCPDVAQNGAILGDTTNHRASMQYIAGTSAVKDHYFTFSYQII